MLKMKVRNKNTKKRKKARDPFAVHAVDSCHLSGRQHHLGISILTPKLLFLALTSLPYETVKDVEKNKAPNSPATKIRLKLLATQ